MSFIINPVMDFLGLSPKKPDAPAAVAPNPAAISAQADADAQATQRTLNRGRTSTILTGGTGLSDMGTTSKTLLGQ